MLPVSSDGKVLLIQRNSQLRLYPNKWVIPGGMINEGEEICTAGLRELAEETGIITNVIGNEVTYRDTPWKLKPHMLYETLFPNIAKGKPVSQHLVLYFLLHLQFPASAIALRINPDESSRAAWIDSRIFERIKNKEYNYAIEGISANGDKIAIPGGYLVG